MPFRASRLRGRKYGNIEMKKVDEYRDFVTLNLTKITGSIEHIKESQVKAEKHLEKLNNRVRKNEVTLSWIKGIGSTITFAVSAFIAYLFKE